MHWTRELPTQPGYYWADQSHRGVGATVVELSNFGERPGHLHVAWPGYEEWDDDVANADVERWCGPIPTPTDAPLLNPQS